MKIYIKVLLFILLVIISLYYTYVKIRYKNTYKINEDCTCSKLSYSHLPKEVKAKYENYNKLTIAEKQDIDYYFLTESENLQYYTNGLFKKNKDIFDFWYMGQTQNLMYKNRIRLILNGLNYPFIFFDKTIYYPEKNKDILNTDYRKIDYYECEFP
ncbi:MAG: hypothetical protein Q4C75_05580 [Bergeyella zoohelcum]|nr:hypothetical protein [Bergeyella zoohelcum]